ncbi:hypothetical protein HUG17_5996 [Dermatophagoides farinae]|uniref:Uncharacterized protein n=1 Tax=Dermatophagoides farinae TaxID=6954 RepID=A0A9D4P3C9_DERFA|nr:hypothetical protein HUG17_5996 [Dermatophagoides farinae]
MDDTNQTIEQSKNSFWNTVRQHRRGHDKRTKNNESSTIMKKSSSSTMSNDEINDKSKAKSSIRKTPSNNQTKALKIMKQLQQ